mmetsp:Transcript_1025/g.2207  ORF Transcript_1025/g.2207 Transcript_1025/m.2207 type:complete len:99 (+) Transcript_1025:442-738(+)
MLGDDVNGKEEESDGDGETFSSIENSVSGMYVGLCNGEGTLWSSRTLMKLVMWVKKSLVTSATLAGTGRPQDLVFRLFEEDDGMVMIFCCSFGNVMKC